MHIHLLVIKHGFIVSIGKEQKWIIYGHITTMRFPMKEAWNGAITKKVPGVSKD